MQFAYTPAPWLLGTGCAAYDAKLCATDGFTGKLAKPPLPCGEAGEECSNDRCCEKAPSAPRALGTCQFPTRCDPDGCDQFLLSTGVFGGTETAAVHPNRGLDELCNAAYLIVLDIECDSSVPHSDPFWRAGRCGGHSNPRNAVRAYPKLVVATAYLGWNARAWSERGLRYMQ